MEFLPLVSWATYSVGKSSDCSILAIFNCSILLAGVKIASHKWFERGSEEVSSKLDCSKGESSVEPLKYRVSLTDLEFVWGIKDCTKENLSFMGLLLYLFSVQWGKEH